MAGRRRGRGVAAAVGRGRWYSPRRIVKSGTHNFDAVIFGGGIAGLWTLARLVREGYDCILLERSALGDGQTIASQGIIHGGIKYTLGVAEAGEASRQIAAMPEIWTGCLAGDAAAPERIDLSAARVLSPEQYLWTTPGLVSRIAGFGASRVIRTSVERLEEAARPQCFAGAPRGVDVYRVVEPVLEVPSVVAAIAEAPGVRGRVFRHAGPGLPAGVAAKRIILAAGEGNAELLRAWAPEAAGAGEGAMQVRPLHMVIARGMPMAIYGHCLAGAISSTPRLTINAVPEEGGNRWTWYIGGELAEGGIGRSEAEQIGHAQRELRACVPWIEAGRAEWSTLRINRAEGAAGMTGDQASGRLRRPDGPVVQVAGEGGRVIYGWPTKLAFAPLFASLVLERLRQGGVHPSSAGAEPISLGLARPAVAPYPWNR